MTDDELLAEAAIKPDFSRRMADIREYRYDKLQCQFWDLVSGELVRTEAVDASIPIDAWPTRTVKAKGGGERVVLVKPSSEIARIENGLMVDGSTWWPGKGQLIQNELVGARGSAYSEGALTINTYMPPDRTRLRHTTTADKWVTHVKTLFPDEIEHEHFFDYAAHMLQRPEEKVNHGIVVSGLQGIGKDTMLLPLRHGVGVWNCSEINPDNIEDRFNGFLKSVMLVVNEVRPHNEEHRASGFYNRMKPLLAAPPELLPMEMKQCHILYVRNVLRVFLTTNDHLTMHIPPEDRRLFVMHSRLPQRWAGDDYFIDMFHYLEVEGGIDAVVHWLLCRDISKFKPGATPPTTVGKEQIIASTKHVRTDILSEAFDSFVGENPEPDVFFPSDLFYISGNSERLFDDSEKLIAALKGKNLHYRMADLGYILFANPEGKEWRGKKSSGGKQYTFRSRVAFVKRTVPIERQWDLVLENVQDRLSAMVTAGLSDK